MSDKPTIANYGPRPMRAGSVPRSYLLRSALARLLGYGTPIPPAERLLLCDISAYNGDVNFNTMRNAGASGVMMREGYGLTADYRFGEYRALAQEAGFPYGCYHFLKNEYQGGEQAIKFLQNTVAGRGQLPPVVDVELASVEAGKIKAYCQGIYNGMGVYPMIYTSAYYWGKVTGDKTWLVNNCQLWVAHWGTLSPMLPAGWNDYSLHQWSADNNKRGAEFGATGGDPDMDLNYCRKSWFEQYAQLPMDDHAKVETMWNYGVSQNWWGV